MVKVEDVSSADSDSPGAVSPLFHIQLTAPQQTHQ